MSLTTKPIVPEDKKQSQNPLKALNGFGQSVWLDYIRRSLISTGELARLIEQDGLRGVTSTCPRVRPGPNYLKVRPTFRG